MKAQGIAPTAANMSAMMISGDSWNGVSARMNFERSDLSVMSKIPANTAGTIARTTMDLSHESTGGLDGMNFDRMMANCA